MGHGGLASEKPPAAIFAINDVLAIGAMRALHEAGVRVPGDIAVAGFDDIEEGRFSIPTLTTISPNKAEIAHCAVRRITSRLKGHRDDPPTDMVIEHRFIAREGTLGAHSGST